MISGFFCYYPVKIKAVRAPVKRDEAHLETSKSGVN